MQDDGESNFLGIIGAHAAQSCVSAIAGIRRSAARNNTIVVDFSSQGSLAKQVQHASTWPVQGVLSFTPGVQLGQPNVEVMLHEHSGRSRVDVDYAAIAKAAFGHLRALNPESLSLLRTPESPDLFVEAWRAISVADPIASGEFMVTAKSPGLTDIASAERERFEDWLNHLARPAAVVCTSDAMALACLNYFKAAGVSVPEDAAIVTLENSAMAEQLSITGVGGAFENVGYEAAELLCSMLRHETVRPELQTVSGAEVYPRGSTDRLASLPDDIRIAQEFIQTNSCSGINVKDVMRTQTVSRVTFERRFKEFTGQTPGAEIRRIRIEKAEHLLRMTELSVTQVASQCGFEGSSRFSLFFRKRTGLSPSEYRKRHRQ